MATSLQTIIEDFELIDDWEDRYRYVIDLGRTLDPLPEDAHNAANKVHGCASQVWLQTHLTDGANGPVLSFLADSDAHIVRGLVAIILSIYSGHSARDIIGTDALAIFRQLGLIEHLTPQRSNGVRAMVERIRREATAALAAA
ncbi:MULTISPECIES: SufE family protein [unclassified Beijerinckia]|uniref:SufE family protein n=1 Tax=unclassified Beijerinckia TaxID=2638183 RepID=UPI000897399E|nr:MULTISPECIES: SufE family protein [unclassified Beijerinckia]MDH7796360.1 cysteine desulfuration protein SufE [Beijerinckia sp. GAS462]SEC41799.1 Cysteine desulfuration protein SufE [Beijerinckia sp. 28-YEA-48]